MKSVYLTNRFFILLAGLILLFILSFVSAALFTAAKLLLATLILLLGFDIYLLYFSGGSMDAKRICPEKFSNGDQNEVQLEMSSSYGIKCDLEIIDEIPIQFQNRNVNWKVEIESGHSQKLSYHLRPTKRGIYKFGALNIYTSTFLSLVQRRFTFKIEQAAIVYPSFIHFKKYELLAFNQKSILHGKRKLRRIGQTMEFEQIKNYIIGDDPRTINWKATARSNDIMVNQFTDERAQQILVLVDKSRLMKMPFNGLSLLDYAINAALAIAHIALKKEDRVGLITFNKKLSSALLPLNNRKQLPKIFEALFSQKSKYAESDFNLVSTFVMRKLNQRSLILLFTNFETLSSFKRQLKYFRLLARKHLLLVVFFSNEEIENLVSKKPSSIQEIYTQTVGEKIVFEKQLIQRELSRYGILSLYSRPEDLSINTISRYIEIKNKRML